MKIRKGDTVVVIRGADKGKTGKVLSVDPELGRVVVQRVRLVKRHQKPRGSQSLRQGIVEKELAIPVSCVSLIDPKSDKPTRIRIEQARVSDGDKVEARRGKVRLSQRSGVEIERPAVKS